MPTKTTEKKVAPAKAGKGASTKKVTAKKASSAVTKKATPKVEKNFKALVCASEGECFWTRDGSILQNMADLHMAFGSMDDEIFLHHANKEKNDFADWVEYVLQDLECAEDLRKAKKVEQAEKILRKHLNLYSA